MKVLHLSSYDYGGAGIATLHLHEGMLKAGIDSRVAVMHHHSKVQGIIEVTGGRHPYRVYLLACKAFLKFGSDGDFGFQYQLLSLIPHPKRLLELVGFKPDVIVAHYISHFLSPRDLLELHRLTDAPVIMNLLDMGLLTGGCHYAWECGGYKIKCEKCPALRFSHQADLSQHTLREKASVLGNMKVAVVAGSSWLLDQARQSSLFQGLNAETILLGVDPNTFGCISRMEARKLLGLPQDLKIIFFGAQSLSQRRKGMSYLVHSLNLLAGHGRFDSGKVMTVSAGHRRGVTALLDKRIKHYAFGFLNGASLLPLAYRAADVFVCPSIEDSGPVMINEAIMCGTPVVAFRMGVALDLVVPGQTGYLAILKNSEDLARGVQKIISLNDSDAQTMSKRCRAHALELCNPAKQVSSFIAVCQRII